MTALAVAFTATPASAVDDQAEANEIAAVIAEAAPSAERVATPDSTARHGVEFDLGESTVSIPTDANNDVTIESSGKTIDISLPSEIDVEDGALASDGTMVYGENGDDAHAAVQALDDGSVRLQTILDNPDAPAAYTYDFGGEVDLVLLEDGSVEVIETIADGVVATLGMIEAPWAVDAHGVDVPTHYTVDGSTLSQHVEHSADYAYPVTADPSYSAGWGFYVHWNRAETRTLAGVGVAGVTSSAAACAYIGSRLPSAYAGPMLGVGCFAVAGNLMWAASVAENSRPKRCAFTRWTPGPGLVGTTVSGTYKDGRCK